MDLVNSIKEENFDKISELSNKLDELLKQINSMIVEDEADDK